MNVIVIKMLNILVIKHLLVITVPFESIRPSPVPGLVAAAEIGHFVPVPS